MNCSKCGTTLQPGDKFCGGCGAPATLFCTSCGAQVAAGASFCPSCGKSVGGGIARAASNAAAAANKNMPAGETVIMDTGTFPISFQKSLMSSINGKLSLTQHYLVFKASALQGVGGVATMGLLIPNPVEAGKAGKHFSIPLNTITSVERGMVHITVEANGQKYKFGAMTKTDKWEEAINQARSQV